MRSVGQFPGLTVYTFCERTPAMPRAHDSNGIGAVLGLSRQKKQPTWPDHGTNQNFHTGNTFCSQFPALFVITDPDYITASKLVRDLEIANCDITLMSLVTLI